jgi:hypothetical protein
LNYFIKSKYKSCICLFFPNNSSLLCLSLSIFCSNSKIVFDKSYSNDLSKTIFEFEQKIDNDKHNNDELFGKNKQIHDLYFDLIK